MYCIKVGLGILSSVPLSRAGITRKVRADHVQSCNKNILLLEVATLVVVPSSMHTRSRPVLKVVFAFPILLFLAPSMIY